jgi:hypothetical protein
MREGAIATNRVLKRTFTDGPPRRQPCQQCHVNKTLFAADHGSRGGRKPASRGAEDVQACLCSVCLRNHFSLLTHSNGNCRRGHDGGARRRPRRSGGRRRWRRSCGCDNGCCDGCSRRRASRTGFPGLLLRLRPERPHDDECVGSAAAPSLLAKVWNSGSSLSGPDVYRRTGRMPPCVAHFGKRIRCRLPPAVCCVN